MNGINYKSAEHAYQSKKYPRDQRHLLAASGEFSNFKALIENDASFPELTIEQREKKVAYWSKKNNIGIIAKMAVNPDVMKRLGIIPWKFEYNDEVWKDILRQKFLIPRFRNVLLPIIPIRNSTKNPYVNHEYRGSEILLEMQKSAKYSDCFFGGVVDAEDGKMYGNNYMGNMLMSIRDELRQTVSA